MVEKLFWRFLLAFAIAWVIATLAMTYIPAANAREGGEFGNDEATKQWFLNLKRPDAPDSSCCGEADAYWCDDIYARDQKMFCKITDDRPDQPRNRPHIDIGTEFEIPKEKLKWGPADPDHHPSNPTGHAIVFIANGAIGYANGSRTRYIWCFVQGTGI